MRLAFSEAVADYSKYVFPYVVWGYPEEGETPADFFELGFLPSGPTVDRFYLARQIRLPLNNWKPNSENRRVLRKISNLQFQLLSRDSYIFDDQKKEVWLRYAEAVFGVGVMPEERLKRVMTSPLITHILCCLDENGQEIGAVVMYLQPPRIAYYYYSFYCLNLKSAGLGMGLMTAAVEHFALAGYEAIYLGTCYKEDQLYKTQFDGVTFFNGHCWSASLPELKMLLRTTAQTHRLESAEYQAILSAPPREQTAWKKVTVLK